MTDAPKKTQSLAHIPYSIPQLSNKPLSNELNTNIKSSLDRQTDLEAMKTKLKGGNNYGPLPTNEQIQPTQYSNQSTEESINPQINDKNKESVPVKNSKNVEKEDKRSFKDKYPFLYYRIHNLICYDKEFDKDKVEFNKRKYYNCCIILACFYFILLCITSLLMALGRLLCCLCKCFKLSYENCCGDCCKDGCESCFNKWLNDTNERMTKARINADIENYKQNLKENGLKEIKDEERIARDLYDNNVISHFEYNCKMTELDKKEKNIRVLCETKY